MNKRKKQIKKHLNIRTFLMVALIMYLSYAIICQEVSLHENNRQIVSLKEDIASAEASLTQVQNLGAVSSSDAYIERMAREKLGLVLPDETVFVDVTGR
ncbi:MAG: septum formation initiator family protein [Clostridia bacterium]|nr:septum formation initiator family protein [Clostridia bacterium]